MRKSSPMGATWFSNLSDFQVQAIEGLNVAIQDDEAEGAVYRTRYCLSQLGVRPMVKRRMLHKLILACRGSDLAFLYFLLEACYKAAGFEFSERIIMSAITYLDLEMTIRELDRILPPGVERLSHRSTKIARKFIYAQPSSLVVPQHPSKPKSVRSPYFMPLPKPKVRPSNNLGSRPPRHVVTFPFWPAGEPPNYNVDEKSRWFANYKFQPVRRMLFGMLDEIMSEYWTQVGAPKVEGEALLCEFHKEARRQEQLVKDAALVKAHKLCLSLVDTTTRHDEALKKRIVAQLDKDIENCTLRWQRLRQRHLTDVMLLEDHDQMCAMGKVPTATEPNKVKYLFHEEDIAKLNSSPSLGVHVVTGQNTISQLSTVRVSDPSDEVPCPIQPDEEKPARCPPQIFGQKKPPRRVTMKPKTAEGERPAKCKKPSNQGRFFEGPRDVGPFVFHYHKIPPKEEYLAPRDVIRRQIIRSLRESAGSCSSSEDGYNARIQPREQVVAAIVQCAEGMWFGSLEAHQRNLSSDLEHADPNPSCEEKTALEWAKEIERFDPDNLEQMKRLLRDAFAILCQDPRCVFASFPNAHESTVVLEWIKRRYGKTYSHKEINKVVRKSLPLFFKLGRQLKVVPKVETKGISNRKFTYAQHASAVKLANEIKADYSEPISNKILGVVRDCLKALDPHLLTSSSMLKSFYAYLPVRYADMMR